MRFPRCQDKPGTPSCDRLEALIVHNPLAQYLFHAVRRRTLVVQLIPIQGSSSLLHGKDTPGSCRSFRFRREFYLLCMPPGNVCEFYTIWLDSNATCVRITSIQHTHVRTKQTSNASRATVNRSRTDAQDLQFSPFQSSSLQPMHHLPIPMRQLCEVRQRFADCVARTWPLSLCVLRARPARFFATQSCAYGP